MEYTSENDLNSILLQPISDDMKLFVMDIAETDSLLIGKDLFYDNGNNWKKTKPLCHYSECVTVDNKLCKFPFIYKGRMYDTCVTLESENPWCSLKTDTTHNHIGEEENKGICSDHCPVQNCPVGFFFLLGNCYHISGRVEHDSVQSVKEAEELCLEHGSRLYQPRDYTVNEEFIKWEEDYLKPAKNHFEFKNNDDEDKVIKTFISLGAFSIDILGTKQIYYNDFSRAYYLESVVKDQQSIESNTIDDLETYADIVCIMLDQDGTLTAELCEGYTDKIVLGYVCEARIIHTIGESGKMCNLPFKLTSSGFEYHSCVYNETHRFSWCPTEVDISSVAKDQEQCPDEREIAYKGPGSGKLCQFPFLYDRVWQESCVYEPRDEIWCPTKLNSSLIFDDEKDEYGYCTQHLNTAGSKCSTNYDLVGGKCIRVSPFPESFDAAEAKCNSEGASLLSITDENIMMYISSYVANEEKSKIQYLSEYSPDLSAFWVGGIVTNKTWYWMQLGKNITSYTDWENGNKNEGCVQGICTDNYRLTVVKNKNYQWKAYVQSNRKPYICESICHPGFVWYKNVMKCLQISNQEKLNHGKAMLTCAKASGHLISIETCAQIEGIQRDLNRYFPGEDKSYKIGILNQGLENFQGRRITQNALENRPIIRSDGFSAIVGCAEIPDSTSTKPEIGILNVAEDGSLNFEYDSRDSITTHDYICEDEHEWHCPKSYLIFHEDCYKIFTNPTTFSVAKAVCEGEGGSLITTETDFIVLFFYTWLIESESSTVWTVYRKDPLEITDEPDKIYNSLTLKKSNVEVTEGKISLFLKFLQYTLNSYIL